MTAGDSSVIIFVKAPRRGMVKTRLGASVGNDIALDLYKCFVEDTIHMLSGGGHRLTVFFDPADARDDVARWLGPQRPILAQKGSDLGERMKNAFRTMFSLGSTSAVLVGSDMPDLPGSSIDEAFASLTDHDAVIGPSYDGGYYMIGFRSDSFCPEVFDGIPWSTPAVFQQTLTILNGTQHRVHTLEKRRDIDTFDDLRAFFHENVSSSSGTLATMTYIRSHIPDISRDVLYRKNPVKEHAPC